MPLIKSKSDQALKENTKSEMHAGKPKAQALAIAYSVKRRAARKKHASGGPITSDRYDDRPRAAFNKGGMAEEMPESIAEAIMRKKAQEPTGGQVDLEENSEEDPNQYDGENMLTANEEQYDDSQLSEQPEDSNQHGDDIESDEHDRIDEIRRRMKSRLGY